jgi:hypothetical protein
MGLLDSAFGLVTGLFTANKTRQAEDKARQDAKNAVTKADFDAGVARQNAIADLTEARQYGESQASLGRALYQKDAQNKFVDMRSAAQAGGFNPLSILAATGGAGFGDYGGASGFNGVVNSPGVSGVTMADTASAPPLTSISMLGSALTGAGSGFADVLSGKAAQDAARDRLSLDLGNIQLDQARWNLAHPVMYNGGLPVGSAGGSSSGGRFESIAVPGYGIVPTRVGDIFSMGTQAAQVVDDGLKNPDRALSAIWHAAVDPDVVAFKRAWPKVVDWYSTMGVAAPRAASSLGYGRDPGSRAVPAPRNDNRFSNH